MASAKGQRNATVWNSTMLNQNQGETRDALYDLGGRAIDSINTGTGQAANALNSNAQSALGSLGSGYGTARNDVTSGFGQARADTQTGIDLFNPWVNNGVAASNAQSDFLGLNGAAGSGAQQQALDTWRNATGYRDVVDSTSDAALRKASVVGGLGGNQLDALGRIGGQLANQTGQQYFTNLGGVSQTGLQAAGQQQQGYGQLASLGSQQGATLAGLAADQAGKEASVYGGLGSSLGNLYAGQGQQQAGIYSGLGNSINQLGQFTAGTIANNVMSQGQASDAAKTANQNAMISAGAMGLNLLTGGLGGGLGGLGGLFGGGSAGTGGMPGNMGFLSAFAGT